MTTPPPPPGGQPPYGGPPPGYGAPPPGYGPPGGYPGGPAKTNTMAIVALVTTFLCTPAGLITGIIALSQVKKTGESGRGMALAAVIISGLSMVVLVIGVIALVAAGSSCSDSYGNTC